MTNLDAFKAAMARRGGISKANRFDMICTLPPNIASDDKGRDLTLMCESAQLPGKQITSIEYSLYGHNIKVPTGFIQEDVTLVFNITNDYYAKRIFDLWQNVVVSNTTFNLAYDSEFKVDIMIRQLNDDDSVVYTTHLLRAYPISVQAMTLDNNSDSQTQKLTVVIAYDDFRQF
jgi:hypothetical protein